MTSYPEHWEADVVLADARGVLLRGGRLADAVPEVVELDLNPVVVGPRGVAVVDAKINVAPWTPASRACCAPSAVRRALPAARGC